MPNPTTNTEDSKTQNPSKKDITPSSRIPLKLSKTARLGVNYLQDLILLGKLDSSIQECVFSLNKDPLSRKPSDIDRIKSFLETTELATKFRSDNYFSAESLDKILTMCAGEMKHRYLERNKILFHIGDVGDSFYIILQGKIAVLQPRPITDQMTGFELYRHILSLRKNNEQYMLNLTIDANRDIVEFDKKDIPLIHLILLVMCIQDYFAHVNFHGRTIIEILTLCGVDPHFFDGIIDETNNTARDSSLLENVEMKIFERLPKFDQRVIQRYHILSNNIVRFKVNLFEYKNIIELGRGSFFGDTALDKLTTRNATIKTTEDTHFCYLGNHHYNSYIRIEKQRLTNKEISFLVDNFFFKNIPYKLFEHNTFAYFYYGERTKGEIICKENDPLEYLYFIKEGKVELTIKKTIPDLYNTVIHLSQLKYNLLNPNVSFPTIEPYPKDHIAKVNFLDYVSKSKIYNYSHKEVIGFECLCFGLNYLYTAEVISEKVKLYKVHKSNVMKMLYEDNAYYERYKHDGSKKMLVFLKRLAEIYQTKLEMYEKTTKKQIYENSLLPKHIDRSGFGICTNEHFEYCPILKVYKPKNVKEDMNDMVFPKIIKISASLINIPKDKSNNNDNNKQYQPSPFFTSTYIKKHKSQIRRNRIIKNGDDPQTISYPTITNTSHINNTHDESVFSVKKEEKFLKKIQNDIHKDKILFSTILSNNQLNNSDGVDNGNEMKFYKGPELKQRIQLAAQFKVAHLKLNQSQQLRKPFISMLALEKIQKYAVFESPLQLSTCRSKDKSVTTLRESRNNEDKFFYTNFPNESCSERETSERITLKTKPNVTFKIKPRRKLKLNNKSEISFELNKSNRKCE